MAFEKHDGVCLALLLCAACGGAGSSPSDWPDAGHSDVSSPVDGEDAAAGTDAQPADAAPHGDAGRATPNDPPPTSSSDAGDEPLAPFEGEGDPWLGPAPRATCRPDDMPDGPISGLSQDLRCNLDVIGKVEAPHFLSLAWYQDCAYVNGSDGTTVIRVAADGTPTITAELKEVGFRANWESMKASAASGLLVGYEANGATLATYDLRKDCAHPELASSLILKGWLLSASIGHAGSFSPDGTIYYASSMYTGEVFAVDLANPKQPTVITSSFERGAHDLFIAKDGTRGYFAVPNLTTQAVGVGSFAVMDLSEVHARAQNAKGKLISELTWEDGSTSQYPILLSYRGTDYLMINDELGSGHCDDPNKPVWGYARIFDMRDETQPKLVSLIKTEAHDPENCEAAVMAEGGANFFGVGTHYCNVDRLVEPRLLACGIQSGGVRVYDIRNPFRPKEVAYFSVKGEAVPGLARIHVEKRELWLATQPGTFYVLKFAEGSAVDQILSE